ncbi:MAG: hypothetical protein J7L42_03920 [Elusimicrobia bacterium]|nr:hypothetical protein [Elusimicrobiota bacterium]
MRKMVKSLSPTEQMIYSKLYPKRVITTSDVYQILENKHKSADYITNLREKGFLQKIKRGLYAVIPPDALERKYLPDKFLIAGKLKKKYYISHHSALEFHGIAESVFSTVYVTSKTYLKPFTYQNMTYKFITTKHFFGIKKLPYKGESLFVSDTEKTFLDCIRRIKYAGGLEEMMKSFHDIPYINYEKLWKYLKRFNEKSLYHKTGFILESLENLSAPKSFMNKIRREIVKKVYYLQSKKNCVYIKKWNLMVPKNFEELIRFA